MHDNKIGKVVKTNNGIFRKFGVEILDRFCNKTGYDFDCMLVLTDLGVLNISDEGDVLISNKHLTRNIKKLRKGINR